MEDTSRRELFKIIGGSLILTAAGSGVLSPVLAQHVHAEIAAVKSLSGGPDYIPKKFTRHNFTTLGGNSATSSSLVPPTLARQIS